MLGSACNHVMRDHRQPCGVSVPWRAGGSDGLPATRDYPPLMKESGGSLSCSPQGPPMVDCSALPHGAESALFRGPGH